MILIYRDDETNLFLPVSLSLLSGHKTPHWRYSRHTNTMIFSPFKANKTLSAVLTRPAQPLRSEGRGGWLNLSRKCKKSNVNKRTCFGFPFSVAQKEPFRRVILLLLFVIIVIICVFLSMLLGVELYFFTYFFLPYSFQDQYVQIIYSVDYCSAFYMSVIWHRLFGGNLDIPSSWFLLCFHKYTYILT